MEKVFYIDLKEVNNKDAFHRALAKELPLPDYYGNNLDALSDVLTESGDGWNMIFYNCSEFEEAEPDYMGRLKKMIKYAESECEGLRGRFFP